MGTLNAFAGLLARGELPDWFYLLMSSTKLVPLKKGEAPLGQGPAVRPVQVGDPFITSVWKVLMAGVQGRLEAIFRPQQVAVGVQGGLSILVHGVRALLQQPLAVVLGDELFARPLLVARLVHDAVRPNQHLARDGRVLRRVAAARHAGEQRKGEPRVVALVEHARGPVLV